MRHASWVSWMTRFLPLLNALLVSCGVALLVTLIVVSVLPVDGAIVPTRLQSAKLCTRAPLNTPHERTGLSELLARPAPACERSVSLPHRAWGDGIQVLKSDSAPIGRAWYQVEYVIPAAWSADDQLMIYSPRVMGLAWQVRVDGRTVSDNLDDWRMTWNRPIAVNLNGTHFVPGQKVQVSLQIAYEPAIGHSMARISVGPGSTLANRLAIRQFLQFVMPFACCVTLVAMGVFFLLFWGARRDERTHLFLALSCIAWCVCNVQYVLPRRNELALDAWYAAVTGASISWVMWLIYLFVLQLDARFSRFIAIAFPPYVLIMTVLATPFVPLNDDVGVFYQGANVLAAAIVTTRIAWVAIHGGSLELRIICAALGCCILAGAHDVGLLGQRFDAEGIFYLPYCSMLLFGSFLFAVQRRYTRAISEHERLSGSLAQRLSQREEELQIKHSRLLELERVHTLAAERQRLMHDMHDGLGSALTTSLAMIEQGNVDGEELKNVLRESVDDLRAVIDSLEPLDGDLVSVLATLRFRLGKRVELAGIALEWDMQDLPPLHWLGPPQALQVMRIVQEVLTNVLKHAAATRMRISAQYSEPYVEVCIADNGRGFDVAAPPAGRGLRHLSQRASSLHGSLMIDSHSGRGTTVRLLLPVAAWTSSG
jgi:signal transduction histidine kinase